MKHSNLWITSLSISAWALAGCADVALTEEAADAAYETDEAKAQRGRTPVYGYNVHLSDEVRFEPLQAGADVERGRALFGIASDLQTEDSSGALFEGESFVAGREIVSNGRSCFTCHRGTDVNFGVPKPPLSASIPADDPIFTGLQADVQQDPDGAFNLESFALFKYRPNRFNQARSQDDPFRQVFFWRKSIALVNVAFAHGFLNDGRGRVMLETDRGAVFSHTQEGDDRFDDLFSAQHANDLTAFQFSLVTDPVLLALRDRTHPMYETLVNDPFATVPVTTSLQAQGKRVFQRDCMSCHNTPNVFNNRSTVRTLGVRETNPQDPPFGPHVGRSFNVGVSERNALGLRFTRPLPGGGFAPIVLPLANEDGSVNMHTVRFDIGLAATTGRTVDVGRFKVPQLRNVRDLGPYFHDNSADTLEEVIDYFNSDAYNRSADGRRYPIRETRSERAALLAFLQIL